MPTAQTAPGHLLYPVGGSPLNQDVRPPDPGPVSGLWLAQQGELPAGGPEPAAGDTTPPEVFKAGRWDRSRGDGAGFAAGGVTDDLPPGPVLAGFADDAWTAGLGRLSDDELIGVLRASRRLASWAAAMELACVGDLWRRCTAEEDAGDAGAAGHAADEIAAALTLTSRAADGVLDLAIALQRLPAARAALAAGAIDLPRARAIADEVTGLTDEHAAAVDQVIARAAPGQTTGQLRAATRRAVIAADPAAARKRKEQALREARVERWDESAGTAALAGRDLPPVSVLAADQNLTALATQLKNAGVAGTLDTLRAQAYLALLTGASVASLLPGAPGTPVLSADHRAAPHSADRGTTPNPADHGTTPHSADGPLDSDPGDPRPGSRRPGPDEPAARPPLPTASPTSALPLSGVRGSINLTVPLATWLGGSGEPGHAAGYGPLDAADSRDLADAMSAGPAARWCITFTAADGRPVAHGCARSGPPAGLRRTQPGARTRAGPGTRPRVGPETPTGPGTQPRDGTWTFTSRRLELPPATTPAQLPATGRRRPCAIWSRSARRLVAIRAAGARLPVVTWTTLWRTTWVAGLACAISLRCAGAITG